MSYCSEVAIAWCLTWKKDDSTLTALHQALAQGKSPDDSDFPAHTAFAENLQKVRAVLSQSEFTWPQTTEALQTLLGQPEYQALVNDRIGLVYGGVTKVKSYVFESTDLQEIRGASGLLDRINLIDLPAFFSADQSQNPMFEACRKASSYCRKSVRAGWLEREFQGLSGALIPQLIVYSTGGNILAFCPTEVIDRLANAIEKRYTTETLTANSCAVGESFSPLEVQLGLLRPQVNPLWVDQVVAQASNPALQAYMGIEKDEDDDEDLDEEQIRTAFFRRKGFSELVGKLANQFNQRRAGYDIVGSSRPSRTCPPMFETHPYLQRDDADMRALVLNLSPQSLPAGFDEDAILPDQPKFSEPTARKRWIGQVTKRENSRRQRWYRETEFIDHWNPLQVLDDALASGENRPNPDGREDLFRVGLSSWVNRFEQFLLQKDEIDSYDPQPYRIFRTEQDKNRRARLQDYYSREARSVGEIGDASNGYVAYIYADGNNMGQYIRDEIKSPEQYQQFSQDVFDATEQAVYRALAECLEPHYYTPDSRSSRKNKSPIHIHPFEIVAIGGDDVLLIVPANKALAIAHSLGNHFEEIITQKRRYPVPADAVTFNPARTQRYRQANAVPSTCRLSISSGVLITAANTPIYYADRLVSQLLKSSKVKAKALKKYGYYGGTVDVLTLKAVTMISSNVKSFREEGLTVERLDQNHKLQLYATPYTLHELGGLIATIRAFKQSGFPKSQLYQIRSLLERGKRSAILNYRYFRVRLDKSKQAPLKADFEDAWCSARTNNGNLAPWLPPPEPDPNEPEPDPDEKTIYSTLWRELVELYDFVLEAPPDHQVNGTDAETVGTPQEETA